MHIDGKTRYLCYLQQQEKKPKLNANRFESLTNIKQIIIDKVNPHKNFY